MENTKGMIKGFGLFNLRLSDESSFKTTSIHLDWEKCWVSLAGLSVRKQADLSAKIPGGIL